MSTQPHRRDALDIAVLGEALVEFTQGAEEDGRVFRQGFGGDANTFAVAAARQGARVAWISAVGHDIHGEMLRDLWEQEGIDQSAVRTDPDAPTGIGFVIPDENGHQLHEFRRGSAASRLPAKELPRVLIGRAKVLHLSGVSLGISTQACDTAFSAIELAHAAGVRVSFDTNLRRQLWPLARARAVMREVLRQCQIALPSYDDIVPITELERPEAIVDHCLDLGAQVVALKLGTRGALVANATERHHIRAHPCRPVDSTGAGDVFGGAFVARLLAGDSLLAAGRYAAVTAALSTQGHGTIGPIPRAVAVRKALKP